MTITKQTVADKIAAYLHHEITLAQLVDWAENAIMDGELAEVMPRRFLPSSPVWVLPTCGLSVSPGKTAKNFSANLAFLPAWKWSRFEKQLLLPVHAACHEVANVR